MKFLVSMVMVLVLALAGPTVAGTLFSDNFDDGDATGWTPTDPGLWSVIGGQYYCDNYGGGRTFSMQPEIAMPTDWIFSADITPIYQGSGEPVKYSGLALVADPGNPWSNYVTISLMLHPNLNNIGIQIHWGSGANDTWTAGWQAGDQIHMSVERASGSNSIIAQISSGSYSASLASPALTSKLGVCVIPTLYGYNDSYTYFDNVLITSSQVVPEPGSLAVLASGLGACLLGIARRRTI